MSNNPTSFRFPFALPDDIHPAVKDALRLTYQGVKDLNDAIVALVPKVGTGTTQAVSQTTVIQTGSGGGGGGGGGSSSTLGVVNPQTAAYTIQQTDFGAMVLLSGAGPYPISLNSLIATPFLTLIANQGSATCTLTPTTGTINTVVSWDVPPGQFCLVFFDGFNWWATEVFAQTYIAVPHQWIDSYNAATGVFHSSQPCASDLCDSTVGSGAVVLDSGATVVNETMTGITSILGLQVFADNTSALAGGLVVGNLYRTGADPDILCVVH